MQSVFQETGIYYYDPHILLVPYCESKQHQPFKSVFFLTKVNSEFRVINRGRLPVHFFCEDQNCHASCSFYLVLPGRWNDTRDFVFELVPKHSSQNLKFLTPKKEDGTSARATAMQPSEWVCWDASASYPPGHTAEARPGSWPGGDVAFHLPVCAWLEIVFHALLSRCCMSCWMPGHF